MFVLHNYMQVFVARQSTVYVYIRSATKKLSNFFFLQKILSVTQLFTIPVELSSLLRNAYVQCHRVSMQ